MTSNLEQIESVIQKMNRVIDAYMALEEENRLLEVENSELKRQLHNDSVKVKKIENKMNTLKLSKGLSFSTSDSKEMKDKINVYLKEIDKCISMLNG